MYGLAAWCPDLLVRRARGFSRSYVPRVRPHHHSYGGGHSSGGGASDAEVVFVCIVLGAIILIALLYAIERHRSARGDDVTDPAQLRRVREMIEKRRR